MGTPGTIDIQAPITDLSGSLAPLPESIVQATSLLRQSCAARYSSGKLSSLASPGRGGMPFEPGGLLASLVYESDPPSNALASGSQDAIDGAIQRPVLNASSGPQFSLNGLCAG